MKSFTNNGRQSLVIVSQVKDWLRLVLGWVAKKTAILFTRLSTFYRDNYFTLIPIIWVVLGCQKDGNPTYAASLIK